MINHRSYDGSGDELYTYYAITKRSPQTPWEKELWYVKSGNGGETWTDPARIYGSTVGEVVLVDGLPAQYGFRAPDVVEGGVRTYFWTQNYCQQTVMVTAIDERAVC